MGEQENESSLLAWMRLGVESAKLAGEIATKVVKLSFGSAEYTEPPVKLWSPPHEQLRRELRDLGLSDQEVERHHRFVRQIQPKLKETIFKLGD